VGLNKAATRKLTMVGQNILRRKYALGGKNKGARLLLVRL